MAVSDIDILRSMIKNEMQVSLTTNYGKKQVVLIEPQEKSVSVIIKGVPDNIIVIKADGFNPHKEFFHGSRGENKRADYVIVTDMGKRKFILCIELKVGKAKNAEIIKQLKGAKCLVAYCQKLGQEFWNKNDFLDGYEYRFFAIKNTNKDISMNKLRTRLGKSEIPDRPELMRAILGRHPLRFRELIGKEK